MSGSPPRAPRARRIALITTLAAVYAAVSLLPSFPMVGVPGSRISIARSLEMGYGILLGPVLGPLTAFLGALAGKMLSMDIFGIYFTPLAVVSPLVAASMSRYKVFKVRGWILSSAISAILIVSWYVTSVGRRAPYYPIPHLIGLAIILIGRSRIADYIRGEGSERMTLGVALCAYSSTIAGHMFGNLIFMVLLSDLATPTFYMSLLPISITERLIITFIGTIIGVPLLIGVRKAFPSLLEENLH